MYIWSMGEMTMNKLLFSFLLIAMVNSQVHAAENKANIGWVDIQQALSSVEAGRGAKSTFEQEMAKARVELQKQDSALKEEQEELQKQAMMLSEKVKRDKMQEFQKKVFEFQQKFQQTQLNMQKREQELTLPIITELVKVVEEVSKEEKLSYVLEKSQSSLVYAEPDLNLTDKVIARYNKLYDKNGKRKK
jgi:outer membrane protein